MQRVAVVTGAAHGLGKALEEALLSRNYTVVSADIDWSSAETATHSLRIKGDLSLDETLHELQTPIARIGVVHLLINNAGLYAAGPFMDSDAASTRRLFEVNVLAAISVTR